jgi:hypothetical protein
MISVYVLMLTFVALIAYAGYDETMRIIQYADLQVRYAAVRVQMKWIGWKLKRQLVKDTTDFHKFLKEYTDEQ